jgi:hypothetical protein
VLIVQRRQHDAAHDLFCGFLGFVCACRKQDRRLPWHHTHATRRPCRAAATATASRR